MQLAVKPLIRLVVAITGMVDDSAGAAKELLTAAHHMGVQIELLSLPGRTLHL